MILPRFRLGKPMIPAEIRAPSVNNGSSTGAISSLVIRVEILTRFRRNPRVVGRGGCYEIRKIYKLPRPGVSHICGGCIGGRREGGDESRDTRGDQGRGEGYAGRFRETSGRSRSHGKGARDG